jgi:hypothetical protein
MGLDWIFYELNSYANISSHYSLFLGCALRSLVVKLPLGLAGSEVQEHPVFYQ